MTLIEAMKASDASEFGNLLIRRECWRAQTSSLEIGEDAFWDVVQGKVVNYIMAPNEIKADDWIVVKESEE